MDVVTSSKRGRRAKKLETVTLRGFGGGWNAIDDDISMAPRFSKVLRNFRRTTSGAQRKRWGYKLLAGIPTGVGTIVDFIVYNSRLLIVMSTGVVLTMDYNSGAITQIFNTAIAAALPGAPSAWGSSFTTVDFEPFKTTMIIHNGVDKPLVVSQAFVVTYLQDLATGSNVNVPIGKYGATCADYHVVAGIPASPTSLFISSKGTSGVYPGDPAPNDSVEFDVGAYAPESGSGIRGIASYRNNVLVFFQTQTLIVTLGTYDSSGDHKPSVDPGATLPHFGVLGHRAILPVENDIIFADRDGVNSAKRNLYSTAIDSEHSSTLITPEYVKTVGNLTNTEALDSAFMLQNINDREVWLLTPTGRVFVRSFEEKLRYDSWSEFQFMDTFKAGCVSQLGRVFLATGTRIYQYGNEFYANEAYTADKVYDYSADWVVNTAYSAGAVIRDSLTDIVWRIAVTHISGPNTFAQDREQFPTYWVEYEGYAVAFEMEMPWLDGRDPMMLKHLRGIMWQSKGTGVFTVDAYVDNLYKDELGNLLHEPALTMRFIGNDARGFGHSEIPFGGGRRSADPRRYGFPVKFKTIKFVVTGSSTDDLNLISLSFLFSTGGFNR